MKICIIRHGETDWVKEGRIQGREDIALNEAGMQQSKRVAQYLKKQQWDAIITSPLSRTKQTADIIAEIIGISAIHDEIDFIERDFGKASGLTPEARKAAYPDGNFEGMEDWNVLQKRAYGALLKYIQKYKEKNIIIVSHGGTINTLLATISNHEIGTGKTRLNPACINMLEVIDDKYEKTSHSHQPLKQYSKQACYKQEIGIEIVFYNKDVDELLLAKE